MPRPEQLTPEQMDNAAEAAKEELEEVWSEDISVSWLGNWWRKWYLLAGHKRLGRLIMEAK